MHELTDRQKRFCEEYLKDLNGTQAAIRAGYSEKTANEQASRLLANVSIQNLVSQLKEERSRETKIDAEYVLNRLYEIERLDFADIFERDGSLKHIFDWPPEWRRSISALKVEQIIKAESDEERLTIIKSDIKKPEVTGLLKLMGDHVNVSAFKTTVDIKGQIAHSLVDLMKEIEDGEEESLDGYEESFQFGTIDKD